MIYISKTIYIDVLICVNLIINYFILLAAARFTKATPKQYRIISGASFGAICSLIILIPELNFSINLILKLIIAAIITFITYGFKNTKFFIKNICVFFLISFCFCGLMIGIWFVFTPRGMIINNSVVYFNISPIIMIISTVICYFVLRLISKISGRENPDIEICKIKIYQNGKSAELYGKIDTGNTLTEPFSNLPVIVVNKKSVEKILPPEVNTYFTHYEMENTYEYSTGIRLIPFNSLGGNGVLPAFIPQKIFIDNLEFREKLYLAVCKDAITGEFSAMVNPEIISNIRSEGNENNIFKKLNFKI